MEQNHTPGPWFAVEYSGYYNLHDSDQYGATNILDEDECARAEHNAKLAAAAPELLEALQRLLIFMEVNIRDASTLPEYHAAQDAIAKATIQ